VAFGFALAFAGGVLAVGLVGAEGNAQSADKMAVAGSGISISGPGAASRSSWAR
jgi:hypothetical protein